MARFFFSEGYNKSIERIEDFILESTESLDLVEAFLDEHDRVIIFIGENPSTPAEHPDTGDQSWPFGDGRYRIFFKSVVGENETQIFLTHIIDNREANLEVYPNNSLPTYQEED